MNRVLLFPRSRPLTAGLNKDSGNLYNREGQGLIWAEASRKRKKNEQRGKERKGKDRLMQE
jgi:hypothetical protein